MTRMDEIKNKFSIGDNIYIGYCPESKTIRQFPQNYMIANKSGCCGVWVVDCDGAIDVKTALMVQMSLMNNGAKFKTGVEVVKEIEHSYNMFTIDIK